MPKLKLSNNALQILEKRYLIKNIEGKVIEKPEDLFRRVANNIALADAKYLLKEEIDQNQEYFLRCPLLGSGPTAHSTSRLRPFRLRDPQAADG